MTERVSLALPIDTVRQFDSTVTQAQLNADTFQESSDDIDLLVGWLEDAEDEFRQRTNEDMRVSRVGVADKRETFEEQTYKLSGHKQYRARYSEFTFDYDYDEKNMRLNNERVLPFDSAEGDAVYAYRGLSSDGSAWEDITDEEGDAWAIINYVDGILAVHPSELYEVMFGSVGGVSGGGAAMDSLRLAVSYRHSGLGGSLKRSAQTTLDADLTASGTGTFAVTDGSRLPSDGTGGNIVLKIGGEYVEADPNPSADEIDIVARGVRGTIGEAHDTGDRLTYAPPAIRKAVASRAGMTLISSSQYRGYLPEMEAELDENDLYANLESVWEGTVEALS